MRIAYDARHAARGLGISTFIVSLAAELVRTGEVELVWLGDPELAPPGTARGVSLHRAPYPLLDGPLGRALIARLNVDVVHFTGNTGWGRRGPVPAVLTLHDLIFMGTCARGRSPRQMIGHRYERRLVGRAVKVADAVVVPSRTVAEDVRARFGPGVVPQVVPEGVSLPPVSPGVASKTSEPSEPRYLVAFAGRDPRKRTTEVVEAWRRLAPLHMRLRLLAGGGLPAGLRESLAADELARTVEILEHLPRQELWSVLSGAFALLYPTSAEGFGLPVLEGMAAGTPVITGLAPVTHEVGGDAIVPLDPDDVAGSIAAAVLRLDADPGWRSEMSERGRRRAREFSWRKTAAAYLDVYRSARRPR